MFFKLKFLLLLTFIIYNYNIIVIAKVSKDNKVTKDTSYNAMDPTIEEVKIMKMTPRYLSMYIYLSMHLSLYASIYLCIYLSMHLSLYESISTYISIYLSI
jgi:hypothetical protein